jgi:hypothetical protein
MNTYDPGEPYDGPPPRRRRPYRRESEFDDAWAAADEDDVYDDHVEIEDLAAGYLWEERDRYGVEQDEPASRRQPDLGPLPPSAQRFYERRHVSRRNLPHQTVDRDQLYANSPSYRKSQRNTIDRALARLDTDDSRLPGVLSHIPFWGILLLVLLGFVALLVAILAFVSVFLVLFG